MTEPYYADDQVTLYLGDCREVTEWLSADILVTDPPYGIRWYRDAGHSPDGQRGPAKAQAGIAGDDSTACRDTALALWRMRPAAVFGSFRAAPPEGARHTLVYRKPSDAGVFGAIAGFRADLEPIYLCGSWPVRPPRTSGLLETRAAKVGGVGSPSARSGHPHAKPLDVMEQLIEACPSGVIADPFAGSGSTLVAARNLGRRAIGVEIEERYCETIAKRLAQDVLPLAVTP